MATYRHEFDTVKHAKFSFWFNVVLVVYAVLLVPWYIVMGVGIWLYIVPILFFIYGVWKARNAKQWIAKYGETDVE